MSQLIKSFIKKQREIEIERVKDAQEHCNHVQKDPTKNKEDYCDPNVKKTADSMDEVENALRYLETADFTKEWPVTDPSHMATRAEIMKATREGIPEMEGSIRYNIDNIFQQVYNEKTANLKFAHNLVVWLDTRRTELLEGKE